jgi:hypothetical protein
LSAYAAVIPTCLCLLGFIIIRIMKVKGFGVEIWGARELTLLLTCFRGVLSMEDVACCRVGYCVCHCLRYITEEV